MTPFAPLADQAARAINARRLEARLRGLAALGAQPGGGVDRQALTPMELAARRWLLESFAAPRPARYRMGIDAAANVFVQRCGQTDLPPVLTGSHLDTQPQGGWLDGAFGVVAGLELFDALDAAGVQTLRPIEVAMWTNEEGCRFTPGLMGSSVFANPGALPPLLTHTAPDGSTFAQARDAAVADFNAAAVAGGWGVLPCPPRRPIHAYLEAHIEQGPLLEDAHCAVGCVEGIQGVRWFDLEFRGRAAHAGTTPLASRDDALAKAIRAAHAILALAGPAPDPLLRLTIGRFEVAPGSVNTIAALARFSVDLRHPDAAVIDRLEAALREVAARAGAAGVHELLRKPPLHFDARLHALTLRACEHLGLTHRALASGAFHDALALATQAPTTMLFAPSRGGVSHNPAEDTDLGDLTACTRALALCATQLALEP